MKAPPVPAPRRSETTSTSSTHAIGPSATKASWACASRYSTSSAVAAVRARFDATFWRDGYYGGPDDGYRETSNVLALAFDLVPPTRRSATTARLIAELEERGRHLDTGIVGTRHLLRTLVAVGRSDLAFAVARQETYPGWGWWIVNDATTLYENWELDGRSHDHAMFGTIVEWMHADVAGISPATEGWSSIRVAPRLPRERGFACGTVLETLVGTVAAEWEDRAGSIIGRVSAPAGVRLALLDDEAVRVTRHTERRKDRQVEHSIEFDVRAS